jgi:type I restriction enzyme, R subunit
MSSLPDTREKWISQIPALQLLINLGWEYLTPAEALDARGGKTASVFLDRVLEDQLRAINRIEFRGHVEPFSEGNIATAIKRLQDERFDGLIRTNEKLYDSLTLGTTLPQTIAGDTKSFPFHYIDWRDLSRNTFHLTAEFEVARTASHETRRPDIVLFINGIPIAVIENKSPNAKVEGGGAPVEQAISQMIRNQGVHEIPRLFGFVQLVLALAVNEAKYATVGTSAKYWAIWKEEDLDDRSLQELIARPLDPAVIDRLFSGPFAEARPYFEELAKKRSREVTEQDLLIYSLCRPARLLELAERYVLFDGGDKKIARYQQYFCVRRILDRIEHRNRDGSRRGGVVWHTQGSGKSLTTVMLAKGLALDLPRRGVDDFKVILVTDRIDLDDQIYGTFRNCGTTPVQATTGRHLARLLAGHQSRIVTTVIDKFETALQVGAKIESDNIFALVDESHRGQFGETHTRMRRVLPLACFIGLTGTPVDTNPKTLEKEMHTALDMNLWVFGPQYSVMASNQTLARTIQQYTQKKVSGSRAKMRPDLFLAQDALNRYLLIEFKRPDDAVGRDAEAQAKKYRDDLTPNFGHIAIIIIGGTVDATMSAQYTESDLQFLSYKAVISRARWKVLGDYCWRMACRSPRAAWISLVLRSLRSVRMAALAASVQARAISA